MKIAPYSRPAELPNYRSSPPPDFAATNILAFNFSFNVLKQLKLMFPDRRGFLLMFRWQRGILTVLSVLASAASCTIDQKIHHVLKNNKQRAVIPPHALLITYLKFLQQAIKPPHSGLFPFPSALPRIFKHRQQLVRVTLFIRDLAPNDC